MAHSPEVRLTARNAYIYQRLTCEQVAQRIGSTSTTVRRWREQARQSGDDWDHARTAASMSESAMTDIARKVIEEYLLQHRAVMEQLKGDVETPPLKKTAALASLADSANKMMAAFRRVAPETNKFAMALDVLALLTDYVQRNKPSAAAELLSVLEPFGEELSKVYG
ncbi:DUF1804 family protein [Burkholderia ambifaria]|uniref:DUF1804 family protein n=1 Tax=Burkholderia ambifaria TaxID=152480 RepID=UPI00158A6CFD|nr:DUF1804 family protein [Burkholderia ambifaria]